MGTAFSTSLFGLSSSLILGFLDLQAGRAQNRFYTELENWLSSVTDVGSEFQPAAGTAATSSADVQALAEQILKLAQEGSGSNRSTAAMASLAEGIQGLVKNMRSEQQMLRDWIEAQQEESKALRRTLDRLAARTGDKASERAERAAEKAQSAGGE